MSDVSVRFRPVRWASVVGTLGVIIGGAGLLGAAQDYFVPRMLEVQRTMLDEQTEPRTVEDKPAFELAPETVEALGKFADLPAWYPTWCYTTAAVRTLLSLVYTAAAVLLLRSRVSGVRLLVAAAAAAVFWNGVQALVAMTAGGVAAMMTIPHAVLGSVFHVALIAYVVRQAGTLQPATEPIP